MNKKVLAVAVIAAMSATAAQADVKWAGGLQVELGSLSGDTTVSGLGFGDTFYGGGNKGSLAVSWTDGDAFGKIGFNTSIGGGLTPSNVGAATVDTGTGKGTVSARDLFIGMKVGPGKAQFGRHSSLYKVTGGVKIDPFQATGLQARANGGTSSAQNGYINSARYSMKAGAIKFGIEYTPETIGSDNGETAGFVTGTAATGIAASMDVGSINVFFATDNHQNAARESITKLGAKMKLGKMKLAFQHELGLKDALGTKSGAAGGNDETLTFVSLSMPLSGMTLGAWVGISDENGASFAVGVKKAMSKKSSVYGGIRSTGHTVDKSSTVLVGGFRTGF